MKKLLLAAIGLAVLSAPALARKDCEELKTEIAAKIEANGVTGYSLEIVEKGQAGGARVVGSCDAGAKEIAYQRGAPAAPAAEASAPR
ncbi:MAG: DUF1161 domain-containing protein [Candidatus Dactylopiibacterium sp.]|nr:DUF1161 domain-containing protein [Candidatus Dactylopiibacterium sp.]